MRSLFGNRPVLGTLLGGLTLVSGVAFGEEPLYHAEEGAVPNVVTQSTTTVTTTTSAPANVAPALPPPPTVVAPPPAVEAPVAPPVQYAPPAQYAQPPVSVAPPVPMVPYPAPAPAGVGMVPGPVYYPGPVWIIPAPQAGGYAPPPVYPQPYFAPPPVAPAPRVYVQPYYQPQPPLRMVPRRPPVQTAKPLPRPPRGPSVGIGLRASVLGISSQQVFGQDVNLWGAGLQVRFRSQGRFGFELGLDALRADISNGAFVRTSYPFTVAPMFYLFQNRPDSHFNIYALAGFGLMADDIGLYQGSSMQRNQQFWELIGQAGGGVELRFKHLALFGDVRAIGMLLDDSSPAGLYYQNVDGGPVPASSSGYKANIGAMLWF